MTFSEYGLAAPSLAVLILLVFNCSKKRTKVVGKSQNPLYVLVPPFPAKRYLEEVGAGLFFSPRNPFGAESLTVSVLWPSIAWYLNMMSVSQIAAFINPSRRHILDPVNIPPQ